MSGRILLTFDPGSSTIKLGLFAIDADAPRRLGKGVIDLRHRPLTLHTVEGPTTADIPLAAPVTDDLHEVIDETLGCPFMRRRCVPTTGSASSEERRAPGGRSP